MYMNWGSLYGEDNHLKFLTQVIRLEDPFYSFLLGELFIVTRTH